MATDVVMPRLSDSMEEGTVLKWLVARGDQVRRGQPLVEIETDKANMTYESDTDGVLLEVLAQEGDTLSIGEPIARIGAEGEEPAGGAPAGDGKSASSGDGKPAASGGEEPAAAVPEEPAANGDGAASTPDARPATPAGGRIKASPLARRLARERGIELAGISGSGPGGRIVKADVESAPDAPPAAEAESATTAAPSEAEAPTQAGEPDAEGTAPAPEPAAPAAAPAQAGAAVDSGPLAGVKGETTVQELTRLQRTVSRRMAESKATVPDFSLELDVDMTLCIELRERLKAQAEHAPSFNDMVVKAAALSLRDHPRVNGSYRDGHFESYSRVNVGIAVAAQDALVVPTIHDADQKSLGEISRQARRLIERVRDGSITPPELSGGTFSVSNLGMYGIERFTAIVNPPQAAILAVGALMKKPAVDERGRVAARDMMTLTLVCDHRILYGADGAEFLAQIRKLLEQPLSLAL